MSASRFEWLNIESLSLKKSSSEFRLIYFPVKAVADILNLMPKHEIGKF
jgi:hypothetical protein